VIEAHHRLAALDDVAVLQVVDADALAVDERAVARAEILELVVEPLAMDDDVPSRDRDVREDDVLIARCATPVR
jgi:hypothetical protein